MDAHTWMHTHGTYMNVHKHVHVYPHIHECTHTCTYMVYTHSCIHMKFIVYIHMKFNVCIPCMCTYHTVMDVHGCTWMPLIICTQFWNPPTHAVCNRKSLTSTVTGWVLCVCVWLILGSSPTLISCAYIRLLHFPCVINTSRRATSRSWLPRKLKLTKTMVK